MTKKSLKKAPFCHQKIVCTTYQDISQDAIRCIIIYFMTFMTIKSNKKNIYKNIYRKKGNLAHFAVICQSVVIIGVFCGFQSCTPPLPQAGAFGEMPDTSTAE